MKNPFDRWNQSLVPSVVVPVVTNYATNNMRLCPLCRSTSARWAETEHTGWWWYCSRCDASGDILHFSAAWWRVSEVAAWKRLAPKAETGPDDAKVSKFRLPLVVGGELWTEAKTSLWQLSKGEDGPSSLAFAFNLRNCTAPMLETKRVGAQLIGYLPSAASIRRQLGTKFRSPGWTDALVVRFYDTPGRLSGLWAAGHPGSSGPVTQYFPLAVHEDSDPGFAWWPLIYTADVTQPVVVTYDMPCAIALQALALRNTGSFLPLLVAYAGPEGSTKTAWRELTRSRRCVLWAPHGLKAHELRSAVQHNLPISDEYPNVISSYYAATKSNRTLRDARDMYRRITSEAVPWAMATANFAKTASQDDLVTLLSEASINNLERQLVETAITASQWKADDKARTIVLLDSAQRVAQPETSINMGDVRVIARGNCWIARTATGVETQVTNFAIEISEVLTQRHSGLVYARGVVKVGDKTIPFFDRQDVLERSGKEFFGRLVAESGYVAPRVSSVWGDRLFEVATKFYPPNERVVDEELGFNPDTGSFVTAAYVQAKNGAILANDVLSVPGTSAGSTWRPPTGKASLRLIEPLFDGSLVSASTIAFTGALLAELLAEVNGHSRRPTFLGTSVSAQDKAMHARLSNSVSSNAATHAVDLGCVVDSVLSNSRRSPKNLAKYWPSFTETFFAFNSLDRWNLAAGYEGFVSTQRVPARQLAMETGNRFIDMTPRPYNAKNVLPLRLAEDVLPEYVHALSFESFKIPHEAGRPWVISVLLDFEGWLSEIRGSQVDLVKQAQRVMTAETLPASAHLPALLSDVFLQNPWGVPKAQWARSCVDFLEPLTLAEASKNGRYVVSLRAPDDAEDAQAGLDEIWVDRKLVDASVKRLGGLGGFSGHAGSRAVAAGTSGIALCKRYWRITYAAWRQITEPADFERVRNDATNSNRVRLKLDPDRPKTRTGG